MVNLAALLAGTNIDILMREMWYTTRRQAHQDGRVGDVATVQHGMVMNSYIIPHEAA